MAAKPEGIAKSRLYCFLFCGIKGKVQLGIEAGIVVKMINGWWYNIILHCHDAGNGFYYSGCTKAMARHAFGR